MSAALLILMMVSILAASLAFFFFLSLCASCRVQVNDKLLSSPTSYIIYNFRFTCLPWDTSWSCCFSLDNNSFPKSAPLLQVLQVSEFSVPAKGARGFNIHEQMSEKEWHGKEWLGCNKPAYLPHCGWILFFFFLSGCTCKSSHGRCSSFSWWW